MKKDNDILTYSNYLQLDQLLNAQHLKSAEIGQPAHHELFFIIIHQTYELWFKQILAELDRVINFILRMDTSLLKLSELLNSFDRISKIQTILNQQLEVLETLTPTDFLSFRDLLAPASGNQSYQFRLIEIKLGLYYKLPIEQEDFFKNFEPSQQELFISARKTPSLFEALEIWLKHYTQDAKKYFNHYKKEIEQKLAAKNQKLKHQTKNHLHEIQIEQMKIMQQLFADIFNIKAYQHELDSGSKRLNYQSFMSALYLCLHQHDTQLSEAYQIIKCVIDLDELMALWRYHHVLMVQRMIGNKFGTGGTTGYNYLKGTVEKGRVFSDYTNLSSYLFSDAYLDY